MKKIFVLIFVIGFTITNISAQEITSKSLELQEIIKKKKTTIRKIENSPTKALFSELLSLDKDLLILVKKNKESIKDVEVERIILILQTLNLIENVIIKNFDFAKNVPYLNVCPPDIEGEKGLVYCGMNPRGIKDPIKRKKYEDAIEENKRIGEKSDLQLKVSKINKPLLFRLKGYSGAFKKDELAELINEYIKDKILRKELIETYTSN